MQEQQERVQPRSAKANHMSHENHHGQKRTSGKSSVSLLSFYNNRLCPLSPWSQLYTSAIILPGTVSGAYLIPWKLDLGSYNK